MIVLFMPKGIVGIPGQIQALRKRFKRREPSRCCACQRSSKLKRRMKTDFILTAEGVNKSFDGFKAIHDLNFYLDKGELRTIIGPNGAGKSTFLDLITGRTRPDSGSIEYGGTPVTKLREYEIYRLGIGRKFQTPSVYSDHTVFENILLGLEGSRGVWRSIFGRVSSAQRERIFEVLEIIGLKDRAKRRQEISLTVRSNGLRSACCSPKMLNFSWWMSRRPA